MKTKEQQIKELRAFCLTMGYITMERWSAYLVEIPTSSLAMDILTNEFEGKKMSFTFSYDKKTAIMSTHILVKESVLENCEMHQSCYRVSRDSARKLWINLVSVHNFSINN